VPTYTFSCARCGPFDVVRPMAASGADALCPGCGAVARRMFGAPALRTLGAGVRAALEKSERSADAPEVVTAVPPAGGKRGQGVRYTTDPRHARLPRP